MKLTLPLPPTTNSSYKTTRLGGFYTTQKHKQWFVDAGWIIKPLQKGKPTMTGYVSVDLVFHLKRERDIDASIKPILDVMQKQRVYLNDKQVTWMNVIKLMDKKEVVDIDVEEMEI